jgi:hypothetical protein
LADISADIQRKDSQLATPGKRLAVYDIFPRDDGAYVVEVSILGGKPTTVAPFSTELEAKRWIEVHHTGLYALQSRWRL